MPVITCGSVVASSAVISCAPSQSFIVGNLGCALVGPAWATRLVDTAGAAGEDAPGFSHPDGKTVTAPHTASSHTRDFILQACPTRPPFSIRFSGPFHNRHRQSMFPGQRLDSLRFKQERPACFEGQHGDVRGDAGFQCLGTNTRDVEA